MAVFDYASVMVGTSRPTASATLAGRLYFDTTNGILYRCTGTSWIRMNKARYFDVYRASSQALPTGAYTKVEFNTESSNPDSVYDPTTNYRFTCPSEGSGVWHFESTVRIIEAMSAGNTVAIALYLNNAEVQLGTSWITAASEYPSLTVAKSLQLGIGDYVDVRVYHDYGSNRNSGLTTRCTFSGHEVL